MTTAVPHRWRAAIVVLIAGVVVLSGCATPAPSEPSASDAPVVPAPAPGTVDGRFPVTVVHGYGATVVPAAPKRVVVDAGADLDALLALGVRPVAMTQVPQPQPSWTSARLGEPRWTRWSRSPDP